jgi:hypothetical protein
LVASEKRTPAELSAFKSLALGWSTLTEHSGSAAEHSAGGSMIAFAVSTAREPSPQATAAVRVAQNVQSRAVFRFKIIVKLLTIAGNHITAYRGHV